MATTSAFQGGDALPPAPLAQQQRHSAQTRNRSRCKSEAEQWETPGSRENLTGWGDASPLAKTRFRGPTAEAPVSGTGGCRCKSDRKHLAAVAEQQTRTRRHATLPWANSKAAWSRAKSFRVRIPEGAFLKEERHRTPWFDSEGYRACTVYYTDGTRRTVREHREVMETHLGCTLESWEHVHHENDDRSDNRVKNLEVLPNSAHTRLHGKDREVEMVSLICLGCGKTFERKARWERHNRKQKKTGPFCGKSCAARWSILNRGKPPNERPKRS